MSASQVYSGSCFCGTVQFTATGTPIAMGYCHCESCRHWSAGPVNAFSLWAPHALSLLGGESRIGSYGKTSNSLRHWCKDCGGHLFTRHPAAGIVDIYAALLPGLAFEPAVHVHYQETVLRALDGLPKLKDMPADMGGSGIEVPE